MGSVARKAILVRGLAVALTAAVAATGLMAGPLAAPAAMAQGPDSVADLAEGLLDAVVNISTSQTVAEQRQVPVPQVPEGSPFRTSSTTSSTAAAAVRAAATAASRARSSRSGRASWWMPAASSSPTTT